MKIYKNSACVNLELDEFLDLLEEDALDDVIYLVMDLDATGTAVDDEVMDGDFDGEFHTKIYHIDDGQIGDILGFLGDNVEYYPVADNETLDKIFGVTGSNHGFIDDEFLMDNLMLSNEDLLVQRIVNRFGYLLDD